VKTPDPEAEAPILVEERVPLPAGDPTFEGARQVVQRLRQAGQEAWLVGGGVRDLVLSQTPKDWDVATSAPPEEVRRLFPRHVPVGVQFGVVRVRLGGHEYEVATFREDLGYSDGRRPDAVRFGSLSEDVRRRDFTINGLALDPFTGRVVDLVGGVADLRARRIRAIGDPDARFEEDHLRPLRAVRFAAKTGFTIDEATWEALVRRAPTVATVSPERVAEEMGRLLQSPHPGLGWRLLDRSGLLPVVLPGWTGQVDQVAEALDRLEGRPLPWTWAAALRPVGARQAREFLGRLRRSTALRDAVAGILRTMDDLQGLPLGDVAQEKRLVRRPEFPAALAVAEAWSPGATTGPLQVARDRLALWGPEDLFPGPLVDGHDLIREGLRPGPALAEALKAIEDAWLRGEVRNREEALALIRDQMAHGAGRRAPPLSPEGPTVSREGPTRGPAREGEPDPPETS